MDDQLTHDVNDLQYQVEALAVAGAIQALIDLRNGVCRFVLLLRQHVLVQKSIHFRLVLGDVDQRQFCRQSQHLVVALLWLLFGRLMVELGNRGIHDFCRQRLFQLVVQFDNRIGSLLACGDRISLFFFSLLLIVQLGIVFAL